MGVVVTLLYPNQVRDPSNQTLSKVPRVIKFLSIAYPSRTQCPTLSYIPFSILMHSINLFPSYHILIVPCPTLSYIPFSILMHSINSFSRYWAETKSESRTTWKQYTPIHRMWWDNYVETSDGRNSIIGKVNSRLYGDEICIIFDIDKI